MTWEYVIWMEFSLLCNEEGISEISSDFYGRLTETVSHFLYIPSVVHIWRPTPEMGEYFIFVIFIFYALWVEITDVDPMTFFKNVV